MTPDGGFREIAEPARRAVAEPRVRGELPGMPTPADCA